MDILFCAIQAQDGGKEFLPEPPTGTADSETSNEPMK